MTEKLRPGESSCSLALFMHLVDSQPERFSGNFFHTARYSYPLNLPLWRIVSVYRGQMWAFSSLQVQVCYLEETPEMCGEFRKRIDVCHGSRIRDRKQIIDLPFLELILCKQLAVMQSVCELSACFWPDIMSLYISHFKFTCFK